MSEKTLTIEGMSCNHCKMAVEGALKEVKGVKEVKVDLEKGSALISGEDLDEKALAAAVEEAGYEVKG